FDTPRQAADALVAAAAAGDIPALLAMFGPDGKDLIESGDAVADKEYRTRFVEKAREKTEIQFDLGSPKLALVQVGSDGWPYPVPIVERGGRWMFDAEAGRDEILARRIGGNELDAIAILRGFVEAQFEYAAGDHDGSGLRQYAQRSISTPGKHDGLSWRNEDGSIGGPIGEFIAKALAEGHVSKTEPYNGYYFRILTAQGPNAPLGARSYIVDGAMIGGFAMVAWPAKYGVTGIQTFQVNHEGKVFQKDLGPDTVKIASAMTLYDPGEGWVVTLDEE
ncbi:MAG: DUF2950 domain-containing protein, partial [Acidobacteria bacterium]|nr:DUF2950 domain-containing protein [Acidobacteriota bacterium]